ncbi:MAG: ATP-binding protein [Candidatus Omnitrophota bacterium]
MPISLELFYNYISASIAQAHQIGGSARIIIAVAIGSAIVGIVIANFGNIRGFFMEGKGGEKMAGSPAKAKAQDSLKSAIWEEVSRLPADAASQRQTAQAITEIFAGELNKEVTAVRDYLSKKYEQSIKEKQQTAEIIEKKYEKMSVEKKQTEAVIRSIAEGLVVVNEKGEVLLMNPAAEKLLGVKKEQKVGQPLDKDLKNEQLISLIGEDSETGGKEIELKSGNDETKKILRASSAVIENEYGKTVGMVSVLTDVTKQRELDQLKSDFVSKVTHELRTPIVTVQNSVALILTKAAGPITEAQEKFLNIMQRNLKRLALLIDDILDLSKLEASKMELKFESCSMKKIINETVESLNPWANSKSIVIERKIEEGLPDIKIDPNRIIQVLNNIIGNAIKFTPASGKITVAAGLDQEKKNALVNVTDTGIGIAQQDLERVFDKFQQVGERVATDISGTGLGLAIAREIIELHGGKIWAESEKGQGTSFKFLLPLTSA